ncbi:hypothetical protein [Methanocorpusculum parvum]|uniref:2-thiouridine synthetase TtuA-like N-terminal LIM domain-containing protein n=1 Tax=Methanocorpusculum parvum TaxID=2193 RepID=A0AAX0Q5W0_9EURY|nr:hypothetical protein [Methanocorpusculum parvum]PAV08460.1 hypothetical protein ASJ83_03845 [Methanocorpusculum parvum]
MKCSRCSREAVVTQPYSGLFLCELHAAADIAAKAKKEIRHQGGLSSGARLFVEEDKTFRSFALRIFLADMLSARTDLLFVKDPKDADVILEPATLDDAALYVLESVCAGTQDRLVGSDKGRRIAPFSVIPAEEVFWYAQRHGYPGPAPEISGDVAEFLDGFSKDHPGTRYALKNLHDALKKVDE